MLGIIEAPIPSVCKQAAHVRILRRAVVQGGGSFVTCLSLLGFDHERTLTAPVGW